jgi:hypothetical protein
MSVNLIGIKSILIGLFLLLSEAKESIFGCFGHLGGILEVLIDLL